MDGMAGRTHFLSILVVFLALWSLQACTGTTASVHPTARPDFQVTPAPRQNVGATATAFTRRIVPTPTPIGLYIVKPGDTLSTIADEYETTVDELMAANNISDPNKILVGQRLTIAPHHPAATARAFETAQPTTGTRASGTAAPSAQVPTSTSP
jgi:LysM repeat protein